MRILLLFLMAVTLLAQEPGDVLISRLEDRDPKVRREAAQKLGEFGYRSAIPALGKRVKDLDEETRFRAVQALGELADHETIPFLCQALQDPSRRVKEAGIQGMVRLYLAPRETSGVLLGLWDRAAGLFRRGEDLLAPPGTVVDARVIDALGFALGDPDSEVAGQAARALGVLRGRKAVKAMAEALAQAPRDVRLELLRAFQKIGDPAPAPDVARLLGSSDRLVRGEAAYTLGLLGARDYAPPLRRMFDTEEDPQARVQAFAALSRMPAPEQTAWFAGFLGDRDERLRQHAAEALARLPQGAQDEKLNARHTAEHNARVRLALAFAWASRGQGQFLGELMNALDSSNHRQQAQAYLIELGRNPARLQSFYPYLRSEKAGVRRYLCEVLGALSNREAVAHLDPLAQDENDNVALAATNALEALKHVP